MSNCFEVIWTTNWTYIQYPKRIGYMPKTNLTPNFQDIQTLWNNAKQDEGTSLPPPESSSM
ncbi:12303_t:CDS:2 [Dentiscutata erythropus]|uniref:12303_t:CDS:1 n=1 Tax=Dentiscutata erythropus TaxID=1348616 RepID=A0A9N9HHB5_9GLOM|nr:12303_t:CDS:2 [Dentiscutata erythropus]